jgi:putative NIF3 family GTP cyclohydrolase 1 type 2
MIDVSPHTLLYLAKSGSQLFGTHTPKSDLDVKGVFLPSLESLILQTSPQQFTSNTNDSGSGLKNSNDDVDITVWSVQFWLKLLIRGDINAVSLLFSHTNPDAILPGSNQAFVTKLRALDPGKILSKNLSGMMGFAYSQAIKYTDKGKHVRALAVALEHLAHAKDGLVGDVAPTILATIADSSLAREILSERGVRQLVILEKAFDYPARASWAMQPLQALEAGYGKRARAAADSGVDFKAFSHSLRVLEEIRQLHTTGRIAYPHEAVFAGVMRSVKLGEYGYDELVPMLDAKLEQARESETSSVLAGEVDPKYAQGFLLSLYDVRA